MRGSAVVATGHFQPARVLTNDELATMVETNDEWIRSRVGIRERRIAGPEEPLDLLAAEAARMALANSGLAAADIDMVVVATCT
ncbi:MAG: 3-oxoacyl-ACP synthase, partial [Catenulispora sp.]|nr:3-oxoacyl-ACP synthase [Catenulispora sp.]